VHFTVTFHRAIRLFSISASTLSTKAEWIPVIVTLARVIANCTASSIELAEIPVKTIVFSTILKYFLFECGLQPAAGCVFSQTSDNQLFHRSQSTLRQLAKQPFAALEGSAATACNIGLILAL
jgi:hypothetical protein